MEKLLNKHRNELDLKVEDAIARAQTPAPMSAEDQDLREQVCSTLHLRDHFLSLYFQFSLQNKPMIVNQI